VVQFSMHGRSKAPREQVNGNKAAKLVDMLRNNPKFAKHLRMFGEAGTVKIRIKTPKLLYYMVKVYWIVEKEN